jgi:hypothetical protein
MKKILEKIFNKEIKSISFKQEIDTHQHSNGEIMDIFTFEPNYIIEFIDGSEIVLHLSEIIVEIYNSLNKSS